MLSLTFAFAMGTVVCPPTIRLMSVLGSLIPLRNGMPRLLGICSLPWTIPLAPMPRYTVPLFSFAPPNAPSLIALSIAKMSSVLLGRLRASSCEPPK